MDVFTDTRYFPCNSVAIYRCQRDKRDERDERDKRDVRDKRDKREKGAKEKKLEEKNLIIRKKDDKNKKFYKIFLTGKEIKIIKFCGENP